VTPQWTYPSSVVESRFAGKTALITGGVRGIGLGTAERLHAEGANVVLVDVDDGSGGPAATALNTQRSGSAAFEPADVTDSAQVRRVIERSVQRFGTLDLLVASAGIFRWDPLVSEDDSAWRAVLAVNLTGVYSCMREAARVMQSGGSMVAIASINSFWMETGMVSYNVSKAGVVALVRSAALELAESGIRVNAVAPGMIRTPMTVRITGTPETAADYLRGVPLGRFGTPPDIAAAVSFLASDDAAWITGVVLPVDGGRTLGSRAAGT
jgi:NAD(P)-dependent dehydrogenase (short-subunit alcohol dehydrogenase family)